MDKDIKKSISATDKDAQYDEKAKNLLGHKIILAHILVKTIDEFKGMNPKDVVQYIEGEPYISTVPVDAGSTNVEKEKDGENIFMLPRTFRSGVRWTSRNTVPLMMPCEPTMHFLTRREKPWVQ